MIEGGLDIGHHVIAREGLRRPGDYREVFSTKTVPDAATLTLLTN